MPIDFTLTDEQKALQRTAREFAQEVLKPVVAEADAEPDTQKAFQMMKPAYERAYKLGFAYGFIPKKYGGPGYTNIDFQIVAEEIGVVDPGFDCILLCNGLALMPLIWYGSEEQKHKWLGQALNDPTGSFICAWNASERKGTANFDHPDPKAGVSVTADLDGDHYVLNGRKYWPSNSGGWDLKGADINVVVARTDRFAGGKNGLSCIIVPRGTPGVSYGQPLDKMGQRVNQNNDILFENCHVPAENAFAIGDADLAISRDFTWSGPIAGVAAVGTARAAYEYVLDWAKTYTAAGTDPIINHQIVGYTLVDCAMRLEAARYLSWKAAHYADLYDVESHAIGAMAKIFGGETGVQVVYDCMRVMGVNSYDRKNHPLDKLMRDVLCFPIYDTGNMGMQRRKVWGMLAHRDFNPRMFLENREFQFTKEMEGIGTVTAPDLAAAAI